MTEYRPYQFAVLRYIPDQVVGEFLNVGVVMVSMNDKSVHWKLSKNGLDKLSALCPEYRHESFFGMIDLFDRTIKESITRSSGTIAQVIEEITPEHMLDVFSWSHEMSGLLTKGETYDNRVDVLMRQFVDRDENKHQSGVICPYTFFRKITDEYSNADDILKKACDELGWSRAQAIVWLGATLDEKECLIEDMKQRIVALSNEVESSGESEGAETNTIEKGLTVQDIVEYLNKHSPDVRWYEDEKKHLAYDERTGTSVGVVSVRRVSSNINTYKCRRYRMRVLSLFVLK